MHLEMVAPVGDVALDEPLDAQQVLSDLYERHFQSVYDFVLRTVRDPDAAADVVQNTFVKAWETLHRGATPDNIKAWLFTVARNAAIDDIRRRSHIARPRAADGEPDDPIYLEVDTDRLSDPEAVLEDRDMVGLVWQAAKALNPKDYSLLDLHLRQGLTPDELAENLGVRRGNVYMMLSRLKEAMADAVTCLLLARRGRRDCAALDALLAGLPLSDLTKQARRAIRKHIDDCERCRERSRSFVAPAEIFSSFALVPVTPELRARIWDGIVRQLPTGTLGEGRQARDPSSAATRGINRIASAVANAAAAVMAAGALLAAGSSALPARDPINVHSTSHELGQLSFQHTVSIAWPAQRDVRAYSVLWSQQPLQEPRAQPALPGSAYNVASSPLADGTWYFHLRTEAPSGMWTDTVHLGPFVLGSSNEVLAAIKPSATPAADGATTPATPTLPPTWTPTATATDAASPSDVATRVRSAVASTPTSRATSPRAAAAIPPAESAGASAAPSATALPSSPMASAVPPTVTATSRPPTAPPTSLPATATATPSPTATATLRPPTFTATPRCVGAFAAPGCVGPTATPIPNPSRIIFRAP